jgi:hypothetical protein
MPQPMPRALLQPFQLSAPFWAGDHLLRSGDTALGITNSTRKHCAVPQRTKETGDNGLRLQGTSPVSRVGAARKSGKCSQMRDALLLHMRAIVHDDADVHVGPRADGN